MQFKIRFKHMQTFIIRYIMHELIKPQLHTIPEKGWQEMGENCLSLCSFAFMRKRFSWET